MVDWGSSPSSVYLFEDMDDSVLIICEIYIELSGKVMLPDGCSVTNSL